MRRFAGLLFAACLGVSPLAAAQRLVIAGDSTASPYPASRYPRTGWGQAIGEFVDLPVDNRAISGRSTRSYRDEGHLDTLAASLQPGDVLLIQFGHNDAKQSDPRRFADPATDFPAGLRRFIAAAQAAQAIPVLLTPVARRQFDAAGQVEDTHAPYAAAVRQVAREDAVALIDLDQRSRDWLQALGPEVSTAYYLHDPAQGLVDDTHFQRRGAVAVACLVASELFRQSLLDPALARRDTDCGVPADQAARHAAQTKPSLIEHADLIARVQPGPHGGDGQTEGSSLFESADFDFVVRRRILHAGASIGLHAHGQDEVYYVLSGRGEFALDGQRHLLTPGSAALTRDGSTHSLRQIGNEDLVILIVYPRQPH
ncbi:MAG: cupin domain-containing protein [Xanthomonadales bacterium]|nr:cupin domain-containing protein [Xanthomonadales bacterium]